MTRRYSQPTRKPTCGPSPLAAYAYQPPADGTCFAICPSELATQSAIASATRMKKGSAGPRKHDHDQQPDREGGGGRHVGERLEDQVRETDRRLVEPAHARFPARAGCSVSRQPRIIAEPPRPALRNERWVRLDCNDPAPAGTIEAVLVCPQCGQENPDGFRLCGMCGTALEAPAPERRKLATLLFCDMSGSTAMGERLDAEAVRELMFKYFHEMRGAIERHGGTVEKFVGDAVMAVFGVPTAHEDDALRAVRAAWEMQQRLVALNEELARRYGSTIALRIGVNTGEVVAGDVGTRQALVTGHAALVTDAVNVAARLEQTAAPGEILVGEPPCSWCATRCALSRLSRSPSRASPSRCPPSVSSTSSRQRRLGAGGSTRRSWGAGPNSTSCAPASTR